MLLGLIADLVMPQALIADLVMLAVLITKETIEYEEFMSSRSRSTMLDIVGEAPGRWGVRIRAAHSDRAIRVGLPVVLKDFNTRRGRGGRGPSGWGWWEFSLRVLGRVLPTDTAGGFQRQVGWLPSRGMFRY